MSLTVLGSLWVSLRVYLGVSARLGASLRVFLCISERLLLLVVTSGRPLTVSGRLKSLAGRLWVFPCASLVVAIDGFSHLQDVNEFRNENE